MLCEDLRHSIVRHKTLGVLGRKPSVWKRPYLCVPLVVDLRERERERERILILPHPFICYFDRQNEQNMLLKK